MLVFFITVIIILMLTLIQITVSFSGHADMFENDGYFIVRVFGVAVFKGDISFAVSDFTDTRVIIKSGKKKKCSKFKSQQKRQEIDYFLFKQSYI